MRFLYFGFSGGPEHLVLVTLDGQANVMLLDDCNFNAYRNGRAIHYNGGWATRSPVRLNPPHHGRWHLVIDRGGYAGSVRAGIRVVEPSSLSCT